MIRSDRFLISQRPYAINLASLRTIGPEDRLWFRVDAVWFRRKAGVTAACIGHLRDLQHDVPPDVHEFLARFTDGRYGGDCEGRWDGENYWGAQRPDVIAEHLALLRPMLDGYPASPEGWDGWWRF